MFKVNPLTAADAYKLGHRTMYQPGTEMIYSNFTPRSDRLFKGGELYDHKMVVFGIQGFVKEFLVEAWNDQFFSKPKTPVVARYRRRVDTFMGPGVIPVDGFEKLHDLGYLPIQVKALKEGSRVPMQIPVLTIQNTHPDFAWLVNYMESTLSNMIWKGMTVATIAYEFRRVFDHFAEKTGVPKEVVQWQGHDFSSRGMSGPEDAARTGSAHLLSFTGTDTVSAVDYIEKYYNADANVELIGASVPATEHSVSSSNILFEERKYVGDRNIKNAKLCAEVDFMHKYLTQIVPTGIASYVSDTYDYWAVLTAVLPQLKNVIMERDGKLVIRPDSGDPVEIICGKPTRIFNTIEEAVHTVEDEHHRKAHEDCEGSYNMGDDVYTSLVQVGDKYYNLSTEFEYNRHSKTYYYVDGSKPTQVKEIDPTPEIKGSIQVLWEIFGGTVNEKGYKVLDEHIGLIYGDSITLDRQWQILDKLEKKGFASSNVVMGIGSFSYQHLTRDTFGSAVKSTATIVNGERIDLFKDPATGSKLKKSAKGLLRVDLVDGEFTLTDKVSPEQEEGGELQVVFKDGKVLNETSLAEIRTNLLG